MLDTFDIVAKPGPGLTLPSLRLKGLMVPDPPPEGPNTPLEIEPLIMPNAANPATFKLPLQGLSSGGALIPIGGATVVMETTFELPANEARDIEMTFSAQAATNGIGEPDEGAAVLQLYPGGLDVNRPYKVRVLSPPDSEFASLFSGEVVVGTGEGAPVLAGLTLERRVAVTGSLATSTGTPLANTPLSVRPTSAFRQSVSTASERAILDNLQFASDLSGESGDFFLWLDKELLGQRASDEVDIAPPEFSSAPRWTLEDVSIEEQRANESVDLGTLNLPPASYARGTVRDPGGLLVSGAEVRWFQLPDPGSCDVNLATCASPAKLLGIWESDEAGEVVAVLPDP
jgi:hypothetical protein